jgi:hypothetical protein
MPTERIELQIVASSDPKLVAAIRTIAQGFLALADAMDQDAAEPPAPQPRSARPSSSKSKDKDEEAGSPPAEEADEEEPQDIEPVDLAMLQKSAKALIRDGKREGLKKVLKDFDLANVSSAKPEQFEGLYKALNAL